jgi:hypothetical protein
VKTVRARKTLQQKIEERIARKGDAVFLTREFTDLSDERQVLRTLRKLVDEGKLVRLGYGVYGRAERSRLSGQPMLAARDGFVGAAGGPDETGCRLGADRMGNGL